MELIVSPLKFSDKTQLKLGWNGDMGLSRGGSQFQWLKWPLSCAINHGLQRFIVNKWEGDDV